MSTLVVTNLSLGAGGLPNGSVLTADIADGAITGPKIAAGAVSAADLDGNQSGSAPVYAARAWVNFDGTRDSSGAASSANTARFIRASGNVTSVVRNGAGDYTVNFTTAMPDSSYSTIGAASRSAAGTRGTCFEVHPTTSYTTSAVTIRTVSVDTGPTPIDSNTVNLSIFR